jgi:hypothetical protein
MSKKKVKVQAKNVGIGSKLTTAASPSILYLGNGYYFDEANTLQYNKTVPTTTDGKTTYFRAATYTIQPGRYSDQHKKEIKELVQVIVKNQAPTFRVQTDAECQATQQATAGILEIINKYA